MEVFGLRKVLTNMALGDETWTEDEHKPTHGSGEEPWRRARWYPCDRDIRSMGVVTKDNVNCVGERHNEKCVNCANRVDRGVN